jgi:hypothetical protein
MNRGSVRESIYYLNYIGKLRYIEVQKYLAAITAPPIIMKTVICIDEEAIFLIKITYYWLITN